MFIGLPKTIFHYCKDAHQHRIRTHQHHITSTKYYIWQYIQDTVTPKETEGTFNYIKKFWTYIKHKKTDHQGISSLKQDGKLISTESGPTSTISPAQNIISQVT
jgi:hypothetical protein